MSFGKTYLKTTQIRKSNYQLVAAISGKLETALI